jgi:hypothetical protein
MKYFTQQQKNKDKEKLSKKKPLVLSRGPHFFFSKWVLNIKNMGDTLRVKSDLIILKYFKTFKLIIGGNLSTTSLILMLAVIKDIKLILKYQGTKGLCLYLKVCSICLQQASSGHIVKDLTLLGCKVSRTRYGLPRIIPKSHRKIIRNWGPGAHLLIKFYLSIFNLYRILEFKGKLSLSTITDSGKTFDLSNYTKWIPLFWTKFSSNDYNNPRSYLQENFDGFSIEKSSSTSHNIIMSAFDNDIYDLNVNKKLTSKVNKKGLITREEKGKLNKYSKDRRFVWSTHPDVMLTTLWGIKASELWPTYKWFLKNLSLVVFNALDSLPNYKEFCASYNKRLLLTQDQPNLLMDFFDQHVSLGRLGLKEEPAGKVRVFAIVDFLTQWLLKPLHKYLFSFLKRIPMDGTFNQLAPVLRLIDLQKKKNLPLYSLDLSAATDRFPVDLQKEILNYIFGQWGWKDFGDKWKQLLVDRDYTINSDKYDINDTVRYSVGQPMGALSSWAMLAVTHHFIIQVAAWNTGHSLSKLFKDYALLGDDIAIASKKIKIEYLRILDDLGVKCGLPKSLISPKGLGIEFAKRTFIRGFDVSPISWRELSESLNSLSAWAGFSKKWNLSFSRQYRVLGYGYISRDKKFKKLNHACQLVKLASWSKPDLNSEFLSIKGGRLPEFDQFTQIFFVKMIIPKIIDLIKIFDFLTRIDWKVNVKILEGHKVKPELQESINALYNLWVFGSSKVELENLLQSMEEINNLLYELPLIPKFDQLLSIYILVIAECSKFSKDTYLLNPLHIEKDQTKYPLQVRLFRAWSNSIINIITLYRKKNSNTSQSLSDQWGISKKDVFDNFIWLSDHLVSGVSSGVAKADFNKSIASFCVRRLIDWQVSEKKVNILEKVYI